jgi:hypothetical protein
MDIIIDCENSLGWARPAGEEWKVRALQHHILRKAMIKRHLTDRDLRLSLNLCKRRRQPITSPLELLTYVEEAREMGREDLPSSDLDTRIRAAIDWELGHADEHMQYWVNRMTRSTGPVRAMVLTEWTDTGRG